MRLPINWLMDYIKLNSVQKVIQSLPNLGIEVNQIIDMRDLLRDLIIVQVVEVKPHPNADSLLVCHLKDQDCNIYQVVCGDKTVKINDKVIYADNNSYIPSLNSPITTKSIRNIKSEGMICSIAELGLVSNNNSGVHILPPKTSLDLNVAEALGIDLPILDLEITPNRSDCMSIFGIARELQAQKLGTIKKLKRYDFYDRLDRHIEIKINDSCFMYMGRVITDCNNNVTISHEISNHLRSANIISINPVIDIVNYVGHILGIPLQIFDLDCLSHSVIEIESLNKSEVIPTISGDYLNVENQNYISTSKQLPQKTIVMRNGLAIINVNGAFYNTNFMCNRQSKNFYLGIGYFNRENFAITNRMIGFRTDNSLRLERGIDYKLIKQALDMATKYIIDILDGNVGKIHISGDLVDCNVPINLHLESVSKLLGIKIPTPLIQQYLKNLGFTIDKTSNEMWQVTPPSWREDCNNDTDLIEEILRSHRYSTLEQENRVKLTTTFHNLTPMQRLIKAIMQVMVARRGHEIITTPFISSEEAKNFSVNPQYQVQNLRINTTDKKQNTIRSSLLPGLLRCLDANIAHGCDAITLYETGVIFCDPDPKKQIMATGIVRYGQKYTKYWGTPTRNQDIFDIRGDIDAILRVMGFDEDTYYIEYTPSDNTPSDNTPSDNTPSNNTPSDNTPSDNTPSDNKHSIYVPGYSGRYLISHKPVAYFGLLNPEICTYSQIKDEQIWMAELWLDNLLTAKLDNPLATKQPQRIIQFQSPYPTVRRDFCVIVENHIQVQDLISSIKKIPLEANIKIYTFDYYVPDEYQKDNCRSITFGVDIIPHTQTLTNSQIKEICDIITNTLVSQEGVNLRKQ